ncbi:uncharacterized protein LOC121873255 [Homarus americanus]|uniref:Putative hemolymph juvenile hormone binding protein JHBP-like 1 n=1 Tax=Homarus americanus TaxID=6706 RepID=A0A8J5MTA8_HOMAM|nr:uncharacterized protein LOC121873255 [Homarus americanus]KAG7163103.1 putative hemolymph juvenile hormone binding protein JHBP-like 1 [Homarus americanus]
MVRYTAGMTEHSAAEEGGAVSAAGEEAIRAILASLRESMKGEEGSGGIVAPPMDPMALETQVIAHQNSALNITVRLYNMSLTGLSEFIIEDVRVNVQLLTLIVCLGIDTLQLNGEYDLQGKLLKVIPISARGPFTVTTNNAKVTLRVKLKECRGRLEVRDLTSDLILESVRCRLSQMTGGALVSRFLNSVLTDVLRQERQRLAHDLSVVLKTLLNKELGNFNLGVSLQLLRTSDKFMRRGSLY